MSLITIKLIRGRYDLIENRKTICRLTFRADCYEMRLFYLGIKKSTSHTFRKNELPEKMMEKFPYEIKDVNENFVAIQFFQNESIKDEYMKMKKDTNRDNRFKCLGLLFGYPPIATEDFIDRKEENETKIFKYKWKQIHFHGIRFICKEENVNKCLIWLESTYNNIPEYYKVGIKVIDIFKDELVHS